MRPAHPRSARRLGDFVGNVDLECTSYRLNQPNRRELPPGNDLELRQLSS